jgi:hypothetical protein
VSTTSARLDPPITGSVMLHLYPGVPVRVRLHPAEDRAVVAIGTGTLLLHLFCDRAELMALRDTLTAAATDLDTARHTTSASSTAATSEATSPDKVRSPAA